MSKFYPGVISCLLLFISVAPLSAQERLYVREGSDCSSNCGYNWSTAFADLQDALTLAGQHATIKEIWVAQGIYRPATSDRTVSFELPNGIAILGGFAGTGSNPDARDIDQYPSVLSGDLLGNDQENFVGYEDNSYHVIYTQGVNSQTILDGFTVRGGNANKTGVADQDDGGAWYNYQYKQISSPTIRNCTFTENRAIRNGGAFYNGGKFGTISPVFENCRFTHNQAKTGGVIYNNGNSNEASPTFSRCIFLDNAVMGSGAVGGVIYSFARANPENTVIYEGITEPQFDNCIIARNTSEYNAGALYFLSDGTGGLAQAFPRVQNCSFYANDATVGGAFYLNASNNGINMATIENSIFWDSRSINDPIFHYSHAGSGPPPNIDITYSLVDADDCDHLIPDGNGSVSCGDLLFVPEENTPIYLAPEQNDFHLAEGSPAINAGSNALVKSNMDFEGQVRIQANTVDIGADEVEMTTPIREVNAQEKLIIYPNPFRDQLYIKNMDPRQALRSYRLFDRIGRKLTSGTLTIDSDRINLSPYLNRLASGIYFLHIDGRPYRIIKQ